MPDDDPKPADAADSGDDLWFWRRPRRPPSQRIIVAVSIVSGVIDGVIVWKDAGPARTIVSALFMAGFVYLGLQWITKLRFRLRPPDVDPSDRDPNQPPPPGGWANATSGQRARRRIGRLFEGSGSRRRRR